MDLGLINKVALVTGSTKRLGLATAQVLLEENAKVVINSRSKENIDTALIHLDKYGNIDNTRGFVGDVTNEDTCQQLIQNTVETFGGIDILITNSGGPPPGSFANLSIAQWKEAIDLSFFSHLLLIKNALPYLKHSETPAVLAVTSFTVKNPLDNLILSNTVRAATGALIKSLSLELGEYGIRFNSILPGWTHTGRVEQLLSNRAQKNGTSLEKEMSDISEAIPLGRLGSPKEFANAAVFLVSPAASYINGVMLNVDGGITKGLF
ncbi:MAG: SDR family oxidoreductase [Pelolinea sp.]|nr:SDR family oxidoreductase [Pelolinea sp.]